jgi:hypothetical protein
MGNVGLKTWWGDLQRIGFDGYTNSEERIN